MIGIARRWVLFSSDEATLRIFARPCAERRRYFSLRWPWPVFLIFGKSRWQAANIAWYRHGDFGFILRRQINISNQNNMKINIVFNTSVCRRFLGRVNVNARARKYLLRVSKRCRALPMTPTANNCLSIFNSLTRCRDFNDDSILQPEESRMMRYQVMMVGR